jgi:hypothetical protein
VGTATPPLPVSTDDCPRQTAAGFAIAVTVCCGMMLTTAALEKDVQPLLCNTARYIVV